MIDLLLEAPGRIVTRRPREAPPRPGTGEVLVKVTRVSLCGSDYRLFTGTYGGPRTYPIRFGHEWAGEVVEVPRGSTMPVGTQVTGDCSRWCGGCDLCGIDRNLCRRVEKFGITNDGFSTRYRLVDQRYLYRDEHSLDPRRLALAEIFAVALHGVRKVADRFDANDEILVLGAGPLGVATCLLLRHAFGLRRVHLHEKQEPKIACLHRLLPDLEFVDGPPPGAAERARSYAELAALARYPFVFECAGGAGSLNTGLLLARPGGRVVCLGFGPATATRTDLLVSKGLALQGSIGGTGDFRGALRFLADHGASAVRMVTHQFPARQAQRAFEATLHDPTRIKVQIDFGDD